MADGLTPEALLSKLAALSIAHETYEHPPVLTCDAQVDALKDVDGLVVRNLFLMDKKCRLYIISALPDTKVDLKVMSARLGLGKGGIRQAPAELLGAVLQVGAGSVTPLAVAADTAKDVVLLLDAKIKAASKVLVHPMTNTKTIELTPAQLDTFLGSLGREPVYVDLEAEPKIDRENPPDLKSYADAAVPNEAAAKDKPKAAPTPKADKKAKKGGAEKKAAPKPAEFHDSVPTISDAVITKVLAAVGKDAGSVDADTMRRLTADVRMELGALKNNAYTRGYKGAMEAVKAFTENRWA